MSQTTFLATKADNEAGEAWADQSLQHDEDAISKIQPVLIDTALEVGALIDGVCCRCGDWVDWQYYRLLPGIRSDNAMAADSIIRLALAEDIFGLRFGGYVEMRVSAEESVIEFHGGYYDSHDQPEPVIDGALRWDEVNHQRVGQVLLLIHDRIIRAHMAREVSEDGPACSPTFWTAPAALADRDSNSGTHLKLVGIA